MPGIPGLGLSGGDATFAVPQYNPNNICIGRQYFGNLESVQFSYLDIAFQQPKQSVGAYIINADDSDNVTGVMEVVYDQSNNVLESESQSYPGFAQPPVFLGIGEATTNIYKVEWRYTGAAGFFGVDNVIYQPGLQIVLSNALVSAGTISFAFQTMPGHTNTIQIQTNSLTGNWTSLTNYSYLGLGEIQKVSIPTTNSPVGLFRVQVQ